MKKTWGPEIWEDKVQAQGAVGVIMGTGFTQADMDRNTAHIVGLMNESFLKSVPAGASLLDVGTGPAARFFIALAKNGYRLTGLDGSPTTLISAKQAATAAKVSGEFIQADFSEFTMREKYDGLFCVETFYHLPAHLALNAFTCFNRSLKNGASALVQFSIVNPVSIRFLAWNLFYSSVLKFAGPILALLGRRSFVVTVTRNTDAEVRDIAARTGFEVTWEKNGFYVFRKLRDL